LTSLEIESLGSLNLTIGHDMKAITIKAPFAWAILEGHKKVENRGWIPPAAVVGRRVAVHTAKSCTKRELDSLRAQLDKDVAMPTKLPELGAIVGTVEVAGWFKIPDSAGPDDLVQTGGDMDDDEILSAGRSSFFRGPVGFVLRKPRWLKQPVSCKGQLGFWNVPEAIARSVQ
jgi:hypothetical protein